jgi:hypothetical protein
MTCPNCGHHVQTQQQTWQERQKALGRCITCGVPVDKWPAGTKRAGEFYLHCHEHRLHNSKMSARRYKRRTQRVMAAQRFR